MDNNKPQENKEVIDTPEEPEPKTEGGEDNEKQALDNSKNPERTKEYIDTLKEDRDKYKKLFESYQEPINKAPSAQQYQNLDQSQVNNVFQSMIDADGYLDGSKLTSVLQQMDNRARAAESRAQQAEASVHTINKTLREQEETKAQKKVYEKYPQLNPNDPDTFDPKMHRAVFNELAVKAKSGEMPTGDDYLKAADGVYNDFYKEVDMNKKDQEQLDTRNDQKMQSNINRPRSSTMKGHFDGVEEESLRAQVRKGKKGALAELLRRKEQASA